MEPCKILINIDTLFDTKFACVMAINEDWALKLAAGGYLTRLHNTLSKLNPDIDDALVDERWANRDMDILRISRRTNLVNLLRDYISKSKTGDPNHPQSLDYKLVINTYPYQLSTEELKELFTCLKFIFGLETLTRVHLPLEALTPKYIKENFNRFIIYDFNEWVMMHGPEIPVTRMPEVTCTAPLCYIKGMEDNQEEAEVRKRTAQAFVTAFDVELISLADVSICIPKDYDFSQEVE